MFKWTSTFLSSRVNRFLLTILGLLTVVLIFVIVFVDVTATRTNSQNGMNNKDPARYAVIKQNFPDPCLLNSNGTWYAFATQNAALDINIQTASAMDPANWTLHEGYDALPILGSWVLKDSDPQVWAPEVVQGANGNFVLYYSALSASQPRRHCIGAATSPTVLGPYTPLNTTIACDFSQGGVIDPAYFLDPATNISYLIFKDDGNPIGSGGACSNSDSPVKPTPFRFQILDSNDLTTPVGKTTFLITNEATDGPNIEGPQMWYHEYQSPFGGTIPSYHLIYTSGCYVDESYTINHIACWAAADLSLCNWQTIDRQRHSSTLLKTGDTVAKVNAPGGAGVSLSGGVMVFHADLNLRWFEDQEGEERVRGMFAAGLRYIGEESGLEFGGLLS